MIHRFCRRTGVAVLAALITVLSLGTGAQAADNGSWAVQPASQPGTTARQYFIYDVPAGGVLRDAVTVFNETAVPQHFRLYGADGYNTSDGGGLGLRAETDEQSSVGAWITMSRTDLTVPAKTTVTVPFTMHVPVGTGPGDHVGAVVALNTAITPGSGSGLTIGVQRAVAARVYARVQGPVNPGLVVRSVTVDRSTAMPTVHYVLANTGNIRLTPSAVVTVSGWLHGTLQSVIAQNLGVLLPGQQSAYTQSIDALPSLDHVVITVASSTDEVSAAGSTSLWLVPWWALVLAGLIVLAILTWWLRHRRRRSPPPVTAAAPHEVLV